MGCRRHGPSSKVEGEAAAFQGARVGSAGPKNRVGRSPSSQVVGQGLGGKGEQERARSSKLMRGIQ